MKKLRFVELLVWILGAALVAIWVGFKLHATLGSQSDMARFAAAKQSRQSASNAASPASTSIANEPVEEQPAIAHGSPAQSGEVMLPGEPQSRDLVEPTDFDYSLWADGRIREYEESLHTDVGAPQAIFRIPKLDLEVAVLEGTSDLVLNRGVGRIEGTAQIGEIGNLGIAGHRDGFFRGLKDIETGDTMELETLTGTQIYEIDKISIVQPEEVWVLAPSEESRLTLVTCYPFYFVGKAPLRYIVHAKETARRAD